MINSVNYMSPFQRWEIERYGLPENSEEHHNVDNEPEFENRKQEADNFSEWMEKEAELQLEHFQD